jgi:spore coat protein A
MTSNGMTRTAVGIGLVALVVGIMPAGTTFAQIEGGTLDPSEVTKYAAPMIIPPAMPRTDVISGKKGAKKTDYYEIAVRQFEQQILPSDLPMTTVWSYGSLAAPGTVAEGGSFNYPAFTIEAKYQQPTRVKWINDLVDENGGYLPHLLPVDQTLHWANPVGTCKDGSEGTDCRGTNPASYTGPVPIITHVHGADTYEWSDGYPEAWYLPAAINIPEDIVF